jgi:molybdopterin-guanine dinucleotide biosynthesis protein A
MGRDKAWLDLGGQPLIERVLAASKSAVDRLLIVISPDTPERDRYLELAARWGAEILNDRRPGAGPLGGIETALTSISPAETALVLACDLPFLTAELLFRLRQESARRPGEIIVPSDIDGRRQPLAAVYPASCLDMVRAQLREGRRRVDLLYEKFPTRTLTFADLRGLEGAARFFTNLNTPEDYRGIRSAWDEL